jgi:PAS domain S-box-containing protein
VNPGAVPRGADDDTEISDLIELLRATDERLEQLLAGQVDTVRARKGHTMLLRRAQQDLRDSESVKQAAILNALPATIALLDAKGAIVSANRAWRKFADADALQGPGHVIGVNYLDVCDRAPPELSPEAGQVAAGIRSVLCGEAISYTVEYARHSATQQRWLALRVVPMADGPESGVVLINIDTTERRQAEIERKRDQDALRELNTQLEDRVRRRTLELNLARDEAEKANRAKSDFLATMSHEIRTPMGGLLGLLELLELTALDGDQQSTLTVARESGSALLQLIDEILDFSKIEANSLDLHLVVASVGDVAGNICRLHSQIASSKNLTLHCDVDPQVSPDLSFDPLRLGQILNNFLNNAIKFTAHGRVDLKVELVGRSEGTEQLRFVVRDTGIGMSTEQVGRLFQPFVQAAAETAALFGGTGLGLVISRRLAELMGGTVEVESVVGAGTTLTLCVAFEVCEAVSPARPRTRLDHDVLEALMAGRRSVPTAQAAQADGTLLLIVDDHPTNRMVLVRQVASLGYAAEAAADGVEALALWKSGRFGAVITDCNMPLMNGYELTTEIRRIEQGSGGKRIPIIACTANAFSSAVAFCVSAGMDDCLIKPADLADISQKLDRWMPLGGVEPVRRSASLAVVPGPAPAVSAPGLLDLVLLSAISGGNALTQADILGDFRRVNDLDANALRTAVRVEDFSQIMEFAHRIKGSSLMLGATLLADVCDRLEAASAAMDPAVTRTAIGHFETELLRLNRYLDTFSIARPTISP